MSTGAYLALYLAFRYLGLTAQVSNAISLLLTAIANTAANRRITFDVRGTASLTRRLIQGLIAFGAGVLLTSPALAVLQVVTARPSRLAEVIVLFAANLMATALRFILYRWWVFQPKATLDQLRNSGGCRNHGPLTAPLASTLRFPFRDSLTSAPSPKASRQ